MLPFEYESSPAPVREDLVQAHRTFWDRLARPGSWFSGAERVAIAAEVRNAWGCALCAERKKALSPNAVIGEHDVVADLSDPLVEAIHRVVNDPGRLSREFVQGLLAQGLGDGAYVEALGILVSVVSIDGFHRGLGIPAEPLPEPVAGDPTGYRPAQAADEGAYVPMIPPSGNTGAEADLWPSQTANVMRAMSLVPDAVRDLGTLGQAQYISSDLVPVPGADGGRAIDRAQIELVAGRVSSLHECFY